MLFYINVLGYDFNYLFLCSLIFNILLLVKFPGIITRFHYDKLCIWL
jgi:hypothetical protein